MYTRRQFLATSAAVGLAAWALPGRAQFADHAVINPPLPTQDPKRVEVMEFFYYGCPHCFHLEGFLVSWKQNMPQGAYLRLMPAVPNPGWVWLAKAYFAAEAMGAVNKLHGEFFNAIHLSGMNLNDREQLFGVVERAGVNRRQFAQAMESDATQKRVAESERLGRAAGLDGVPMFVVDGRYRTSISMAGGYDKVFPTVNNLIVLAQRNKKA